MLGVWVVGVTSPLRSKPPQRVKWPGYISWARLVFCREYSFGNAMPPADVWLPKAYRLHSDRSRRQSKSETASLGADWSRGSLISRDFRAFIAKTLHSRFIS